jgi:hypothetical protein
MDNEEQKSNLWKTYGILMGIMLGGSALILVGQLVWNNFQAEQSRQASLETERREKYSQVYRKLIENNNIKVTGAVMALDDIVPWIKDYLCVGLSSADNSQQSSLKDSSTFNEGDVSKIAGVMAYCPENLVKLPKELQAQVSNLDHITQKQATALINRWLEAKKSLFSSPFDRRLATEILIGKALEDRMSSIDWLVNYSSWYSYESQRIDSVDAFVSSNDTATITLTITEARTLHQPNKDTRSGETSQSIFYLTQKDGSVKISDVHNK